MTGAPHNADAQFVRRAMIVIGLTAAALLLWQVRGVVVLLFGAVLVATVIRAIADPLHNRFHVPERLAVLLSVLLIVGLIAGTLWLIGAQISAQSKAVAGTLPQAIGTIDAWLAGFGIGHPIQQWLARVHSGGGLVGPNLAGLLSSLTFGAASFLILFFGGIFLAAQPLLYGAGIIKLIPPERRAVVAEAIEDSERALRLWLKGQLWAMILIGLLTWAGLWLLGVPSALVLSL
ncbi:MAG TPA: AI-2E family transporter, partial [Sphingomicrobium sp.]|nr:AI-2E family transporter [Sphingomicrobium sp.]